MSISVSLTWESFFDYGAGEGNEEVFDGFDGVFEDEVELGIKIYEILNAGHPVSYLGMSSSKPIQSKTIHKLLAEVNSKEVT